MKTQYRRIYDFIAPYRSIWADSVLQNWPLSSAYFLEEWIESLTRLSEDGLRIFANACEVPGIHPDLARMIAFLDAFESIEGPVQTMALDAIESQGLNLKKQHEIERLLPVLVETSKEVTHAVDIGGGMGHLARICVKRFDWQFHTIDRDLSLQEKGRWWLKRSRGLDRDKLIFVPGEFSEREDGFAAYFSAPETLSLGLHTCGSLAVSQFRKSLRSDLIVNFGCCYDKTSMRDLNLSFEARDRGIPWNQSSLFLATRSRKDLSESEFALLRRVNDYRFTFDLLMREYFPELGFVIAGDAPKALYTGSFPDYVMDRIRRSGISGSKTFSPDELLHFRERKKEEVFRITVSHFIRNLFARALERLLLLDRAIWLEEQGFQVELRSIFDRKISPRNLGIIARRLAE